MEETTGRVESEKSNAGEIDALRLENERLRDELKIAAEKVAGLEKAVAVKDDDILALGQSLEESGKKLEETEKSLAGAVSAYKEMAVQTNTGLVAEMIKGNTVAEIKDSVEYARALVEKVKQEIGEENARVRVPAGAPQRTAPDLSALSPREKIKYGMEG